MNAPTCRSSVAEIRQRSRRLLSRGLVAPPQWTLMLAMGLVALAGCGEAGTETDVMEVVRTPIIAGLDLTAAEAERFGLVAIYHPKLPAYTFAPRPCSGVIVRNTQMPPPFTGSITTVLTARHCVTMDGSPMGEIAMPDMLRLIPGTNPGPAMPDPPPGAVSAMTIVDFSGGDRALVTVVASWPAKRFGLYVGGQNDLIGLSLTAFGYGLHQLDPACGGNPANITGAGRARRGGPFTIIELTGDHASLEYYFSQPAPGGQQRVSCGDSGGPQFTSLGGIAQFGGTPWDHLVGTNVGEVDGDGIGDPITREMQEVLGGLYLSAIAHGVWSGTGLDVAVRFGALSFVSPTSTTPYPVKVKFDVDLARVYLGAQCLSAGLDSSQQRIVFAATCDLNDARQRWSYGRSLQIGSDWAGMCLAASGTRSVGLALCSPSAANQRWFMHAQP